MIVARNYTLFTRHERAYKRIMHPLTPKKGRFRRDIPTYVALCRVPGAPHAPRRLPQIQQQTFLCVRPTAKTSRKIIRNVA
jgi:hypothetical protein